MNRFVIVGTQRTGSSLLGHMLGSHPAIVCGWEWTQYEPRSRKLEVARRALTGDFTRLAKRHRDHMATAFARGTPDCLGFRRLFGASDKWLVHPRFSLSLWRDRFEDHLDWFRDFPELHILHIVRADNVEWLKSKYLSKKTRNFVGRAYPGDARVVIPVRQAIARVRSKHWIDARLGSLASSNPYMLIEYERIVAEGDAVLARALRVLGVDPAGTVTPSAPLRRQSTRSVTEYVANHADLVRHLGVRALLRAPVMVPSC